MSIASLLTQKCEIYSPSTTKGRHKSKIIWNPEASNVPCRVFARRADIDRNKHDIDQFSSSRVTIVLLTNNFLVGWRIEVNGQKYKVEERKPVIDKYGSNHRHHAICRILN